MTFIAPARGVDLPGAVHPNPMSFRRLAKMAMRRRVADEDGAREALGVDPQVPVCLLPGTSLEHLARIALG